MKDITMAHSAVADARKVVMGAALAPVPGPDKKVVADARKVVMGAAFSPVPAADKKPSK